MISVTISMCWRLTAAHGLGLTKRILPSFCEISLNFIRFKVQNSFFFDT